MRHLSSKKTALAATILLLVVTAMAVMADEQADKFDADRLIGRWRGEGSFLMPMTGIDISVDGEADFTPDTAHGCLRTAMTGSTFMFSYSDSGHLTIDPATDSLRWEIWDGFGR